VRDILRRHADGKATYKALREQGLTKTQAEEEIACALMACMWETLKGWPNRWSSVLAELRNGRSTTELFPDALYEDAQDTTTIN
jgi:hypothetical protein